MKLYAYCLSDEIAEGDFENVSGVGGARVRLTESQGITGVVSGFSESSIAVTRENVLAHERVVRQAFRNASLLPFRFGTVVTESSLMDFINAQKSALKLQLERVRGCVEMSVKVVWPDATRADGTVQGAGGEEEERAGSGTDYLKKKRREIFGDAHMNERADEIASWVSEKLQGAVRYTMKTAQPSGSPVLALSYLVERERVEEYRELLNAVRRERPHLHFLTSGPWPPYSFSDINS